MAGPFGTFGVGVNLPGNTFDRLAYPRSALADALAVLGDTAEKLSVSRQKEKAIDLRGVGKAKSPKPAYTLGPDGEQIGALPVADPGTPAVDGEYGDEEPGCADGSCGVRGGYSTQTQAPAGKPKGSPPIEVAGRETSPVNPKHVAYGDPSARDARGVPMSVEEALAKKRSLLEQGAARAAGAKPESGQYATLAALHDAKRRNASLPEKAAGARLKVTEADIEIARQRAAESIRLSKEAKDDRKAALEESEAGSIAEASNMIHSFLNGREESLYSPAMGKERLASSYSSLLEEYRKRRVSDADKAEKRASLTRSLDTLARATLGSDLTKEERAALSGIEDESIGLAAIQGLAARRKSAKDRDERAQSNIARANAVLRLHPVGGAKAAALIEGIMGADDPGVQEDLINDYVKAVTQPETERVNGLTKQQIASEVRGDYESATRRFNEMDDAYRRAKDTAKAAGADFSWEQDPTRPEVRTKKPGRASAAALAAVEHAKEALLRAYRTREKTREKAAAAGYDPPPALELPEELRGEVDDTNADSEFAEDLTGK